MEYETPELTVLSSAVDAIQVTGGLKSVHFFHWDGGRAQINDSLGAYEDWE